MSRKDAKEKRNKREKPMYIIYSLSISLRVKTIKTRAYAHTRKDALRHVKPCI